MNWQIRNENMLWTDSIDVARDFVLVARGDSSHTIIIGVGMYEEVRDARDMTKDFLGACPHVRSRYASLKLWIVLMDVDGINGRSLMKECYGPPVLTSLTIL